MPVPGKDNAPADALLRPPELSCLTPTNIPPFLSTDGLFYNRSIGIWSAFPSRQETPRQQHVLLCSTSTGMDRPLLPPEFCHKAFDTLHALSHPGVSGSCRPHPPRLRRGCSAGLNPAQSTFTAWVPPPGIWHSSRPFSPWYPWLPLSGCLEIIVAWHE